MDIDPYTCKLLDLTFDLIMLARTATSATLALAAAVLLAPAFEARGDAAVKKATARATLPATPAATSASASDDSLAPSRVRGVGGKVSGATNPLSAAQVYLYRVSDLSLVKAVTDERGHFLFDTLPAGLYKVIAHKAGFLPAVVQLTRTTAQAYQFLELELSEARRGAEARGEDFWSLRSQVPTDVLRDIQLADIQDQTRRAGFAAAHPATFMARDAAPERLAASMTAMTGIEQTGVGEGEVHRGEVGIEGQVGSMQLGLSGDFMELGPALDQTGAGGPVGSAHNLSLSARDDNMSVRIDSRNDRLQSLPEQRGEVGFETYRLAVSHDVGERGRSDFIAQYSSETNFHRHGWIDPQTIPEASRSWRLEGTYTAELSERASLQTGLRYRERTSGFGFAVNDDSGREILAPEQQRVDLFGRAGMQVQPSVLVEYGLYTTLRDGSVSLSPRGGLILQLAPAWQAAMAASYKVHEEGETPYADFMPSLRTVDTLDDSCEENDGHCYQVVLTHQSNDDDSLSIGATHRLFDETQRVYFSDELMDRYESLYLVPGDEIPEVQVAITRRLSPQVTTRFQSNLAEGGGGMFLATDSQPYENQVSYLTTSLDTHFGQTSTGLFVAFHRLKQSLQRSDFQGRGGVANEMDVERLELMLTQDLNFLVNMATEMALQLNMQVSRGSLPFVTNEDEDDDLRKRLMGGIALRF